MSDLQRQGLSPDNPWPGLASFDETDRGYFHGRDAEARELLRLIRREMLTVLFGRSGLGKTSLLKAGLFQLLRGEYYLPVYMRLDHRDGAPPLCTQIFHGLQAECAAKRVEASQPAESESLWSFFHRRDVELWDERNRPVTPVLVFDQFEEIFTLGQETEPTQARSAAFLTELSNLVENRLPDSIRQELEVEPTSARRFDFERSKVKLVVSLREDFLPDLEGLKEQMPSLMFNRFRLLAMNGAQAYEVITRAGGDLVDDDVARRILRLAWKNEPGPPVDPSAFPGMEIDPSLLSVVCHELYKRHLADPSRKRMTPALLEGTDREILSGFYERSMADLDPRVGAFVENELITARGYRDSYALEDALALPGITSEAINVLIQRRLLRVDERQGLRRLELTHDVLTRVVKESRDSRRIREAEDAAKARERKALEQQQMLEQQRRNRRNAAFVLGGALVVIVLAVLAGWFAWKASRLLREAEVTRLMANADRLQGVSYDASLLVNLEAIRVTPTLDASAGLLRRFVSHPHLSTFLPGHDTARDVAFSPPDGKRLASANGDAVILWDVDSRKRLATLEGHDNGVSDVAFSPDGKLLASASDDQTVILWDVESRKPLATLKEHKGEVFDVAFSADGKRLASASKDDTVILWDVDSRKPLATLEGHKGWVMAVAFSADGKRLASASYDDTVILWDVDSRKPLATLEGHENGVSDVAFSPDGKRLASASLDMTVILWDVDSRKPLATLEGHKGSVYGVAFSADGKRLASAGADDTVILWDVDSRKPLATLEGHKGAVFGVAFSPDGKRLASANLDDTVILWDMDSRKGLATLEGHESWVFGVAFSPDGKRLASADGDDTLILWDVDSRKGLRMSMGDNDGSSNVAFSPDGKLASAGNDGTVILWDLDSGEGWVLEEGEGWSVYDVAFSPDGKRLASASADRTVTLWDVDSRKQLALEGHEYYVSGVAFSPDGKRLASASFDHTVLLWDVDSRKRLATLDMQKGQVYDVAFSPDGKRLAAGLSGTVVLWDVEHLDHLRQLATLEGLEEDRDTYPGIAFSPDGKRLASASDRTVILWDVDRHKPLVTLEGHRDVVTNVAFSLDGKRMASVSKDKTVILWNLDLDDLKAEACRTANRNLTCEEWRNYIGADKPYQKTCEELPLPEEKCS